MHKYFCRIVTPQLARRDELQAFHGPSYVECLAAANDYASTDEIADDSFIEDLEQYGIGIVCVCMCYCMHVALYILHSLTGITISRQLMTAHCSRVSTTTAV